MSCTCPPKPSGEAPDMPDRECPIHGEAGFVECEQCGGLSDVCMVEGTPPNEWPPWMHPADYAVPCPTCRPERWEEKGVDIGSELEAIGAALCFNGWGQEYSGPG